MTDVRALGLNGCSTLIDRISTELAASLSKHFGLRYASSDIPRIAEKPRPADLPRAPDWLLIGVSVEEARTLRLSKGSGFYFLKDVRPTDWPGLKRRYLVR